MMKKESVFINIGRGKTVRQEELAEALKEEAIRGAVLDVYEEEPLPKESPLWGLENAAVYPHVSCRAIDENERRTELYMKLMGEFLEGKKEMENRVEVERGY